MEGTFHRRELPAPAVSFSSPEGRVLFTEGLAQGTMESYFMLAEHYQTQSHPAFCGIASLAMALNALLVDPGKVWQGVWRWYDESMLDSCETHEAMKLKGITLAKLACVARCNRANVTLHYGPERSLEQFRADVKAACSQPAAAADTDITGAGAGAGSAPPGGVASCCGEGPGGSRIRIGSSTSCTPAGCTVRSVLIVSYCRATLSQTGTGHFSPLGGYHGPSDSVLVMDVARFKYAPHWVPLPLLYEALQPHDPEAGRPRGYMVVQSSDELRENSCCGCREGAGTGREGNAMCGVTPPAPPHVDEAAPVPVPVPVPVVVPGSNCGSGSGKDGDRSTERAAIMEEINNPRGADSLFSPAAEAVEVGDGDRDGGDVSLEDLQQRKRQRSMQLCTEDLRCLLDHRCELCVCVGGSVCCAKD